MRKTKTNMIWLAWIVALGTSKSFAKTPAAVSAGTKGATLFSDRGSQPSQQKMFTKTPAAVSAGTKGATLFSEEKEKSLKNNSKSELSFHINGEGQVTQNQIDRNNKSFHPSLPWTEILALYNLDQNINFSLGLSLEQTKQDWTMEWEEISLSYSFHFIPLELNIGYQPLPLGYREQNERLFARELSFYSVLNTKKEDLALTSHFKVINDFLSIEGTVFGGWQERTSDNLYKAPDSLPFIISLKSQGPFWSAFASWFQKDPAFAEPLKAIGGGIQGQYKDKDLKLSLKSALWYIGEQQQSTIAFYINPALTLYKVTAGTALGSMNRFFPDLHHPKVVSALYDKSFYIAFKVHPNMELIGERWISGQEKGPLTHSLWSLRLKISSDVSL